MSDVSAAASAGIAELQCSGPRRWRTTDAWGCLQSDLVNNSHPELVRLLHCAILLRTSPRRASQQPRTDAHRRARGSRESKACSGQPPWQPEAVCSATDLRDCQQWLSVWILPQTHSERSKPKNLDACVRPATLRSIWTRTPRPPGQNALYNGDWVSRSLIGASGVEASEC